jgi:hypothetical protein
VSSFGTDRESTSDGVTRFGPGSVRGDGERGIVQGLDGGKGGNNELIMLMLDSGVMFFF